MDDRPERNRFMDFLLFRALKDQATPEEQDHVTEWRRESSRNEHYFREMELLLEITDDHGRRPIPTPGPAPDVRRVIRMAERPAIGVLVPGRRGPQPTPRGWFRPAGLGLLAASLVAAALLVRGGGPAPVELLSFGVDEFTTGSSDVATVQLRDGTVVRLAPHSRLRLNTSPGERAVTLDGRAYFAVARMEEYPFVVRTGGGEAVVLGTRFEAEARGAALRLMVVEGSVALASAGSRVELQAGEMARSVDGAVSDPVRVPDPWAGLAWVGDFLVFQRTPLQEVLLEIEGHFQVPVRLLGDGERANVTAWFADPVLDDVVSVVCQVLGATCSIEEGGVTIDLRGRIP